MSFTHFWIIGTLLVHSIAAQSCYSRGEHFSTLGDWRVLSSAYSVFCNKQLPKEATLSEPVRTTQSNPGDNIRIENH